MMQYFVVNIEWTTKVTQQSEKYRLYELLTDFYRVLHIHPIRTSPYHPQTDSLVEIFNQTLKSMQRKAATKNVTGTR